MENLVIDHIKYIVGNAKQASSYYILRYGFQPYAYKGLETNSREEISHVVRQGEVVLEFNSWYVHCTTCNDRVSEIVFRVNNTEYWYWKSLERGAVSVRKPMTTHDRNGKITYASIDGCGGMIFTFLERENYNGFFLPGYIPARKDCLSEMLKPVGLNFIDHIAFNVPFGQMNKNKTFLESVLQFNTLCTFDKGQVGTISSDLSSCSLFTGSVVFNISEPVNGDSTKKSQIQEFLEYNGKPGVQHIAFHTSDIITTVSSMKMRGVRFLTILPEYYVDLQERISTSGVCISVDLGILKELGILLDFSENGYLLQIFTENCGDLPTIFLEIIQRNNFNGFGAGNFKALFKSIENEQRDRGNLL